MIDEYITPKIFNDLKDAIAAECDRRCYSGSVKDTYGSESGKYHNLVVDEMINAEDYLQYKNPLQAIVGTQDSQLSKILGESSISALKVGEDVLIKYRDLFNKENILILQALTTILKADPITVTNQAGTHCAASCTGLCYQTCTGTCYDTCSGRCKGRCSGSCSSGCSGSGGGGGGDSGGCSGCDSGCGGFCTGSCHSTCRSSSGSCGRCGSGCDSSCSEGCRGGASSNSTVPN